MKRNSLFMFCLAGVFLLSGTTFTSCLQSDDVDTNQYVGGISLNVFGPSPVARGGELRFLGSGLDQVAAVLIPGCEDITDIQIVSSEEIRITVPQTAEPGYVTLTLRNGESITTKTRLTYLEPISIDGFSSASVKPGDVLTIQGEYLNLIHQVIFADDVVVSDELIAGEDSEGVTTGAGRFLTHTRNEIQVIVPEEAKSGQIILSDGAELPNLIYSEEELEVLLPAVASVVDKIDAKPGETVKIQGIHLDLVRKVVMPGGTETVFTLLNENTLEFQLPESASDGEVILLPASEVEVPAVRLTMAVPTGVVANPSSGLWEGMELTLQGKNLELVTDVVFPGVAEAVSPVSKSETALKVIVPNMAQSGNLTLNTGSGKQVNVAINMLKPEVDSYSPETVPAGELLTVIGKNLELVASVTFEGGKTVEVVGQTTDRLSVTVPMEAETGKVVLNLKNGESVEGPVLTVSKPQCCYAAVLPESVDAGALLEMTVANGDKLEQVRVNGAAAQFILRESTLLVSLPSDVTGEVSLELISSNGSITYPIVVMGSMGTLIFEGPVATGGWANSAQIAADKFVGAQVGQVITVIVSDLLSGAQGSFKNGSWSAIAPDTEYFNIDGNFSLTITSEILSQLQSGGLIVSGQNYTIESVYIK